MNALSALTLPKPDAAAIAKQQICHAVVTEGARYFADTLQTVILTGSMARNEATLQPHLSGVEVLGDAEFVLVFRQLPAKAALRTFIAHVQEHCAAEQIVCKIDCSTVRPEYFRRLRPTIYSYELLTCGQVCWGESSSFVSASRFSAGSIAHEDAWRMLCNRLIELLEVLPQESTSVMGPEVQYRAMKLNLDLVTSILVFAGLYEYGYENRARIFQQSQELLPPIAGITSQLSKEVGEATAAKLGRGLIEPLELPRLRMIISRTLAVCAWELQQMLSITNELEESTQLMRAWMSRQSLRSKLRGWAYVARGQGWLGDCRQWPRWARMAFTASPRYWIYLAALESAQAFASGQTNNQALQNYLPLTSGKETDAWQQIARNYGECATGTTA